MIRAPTLGEKAKNALDTVAHRFRSELQGAVDFEELRSMGSTAAAEAVERWDGRGDFGAFAMQRIRWAILDELRREVRQQRWPRAHDEIAGVLATQEAAEAADRAMERALRTGGSSLDDLCGDAAADYFLTVKATPVNEESLSGEELVQRDADRIRIRRAIARLPPPLGEVVERHVYRGESFHEIGQALGVHKATAADIYARAVRWLRVAFCEPEPPAAEPSEASAPP